MAADAEFERLVKAYYRPLYQFALSLARAEAEAWDLTQQTFYIWAVKGGQLREPAKVKTWLFTTLHREFLSSRRREVRFPHLELEAAQSELPPVAPVTAVRVDGAAVLAALGRVDEPFRGPLALFYLEDYSYREIAETLEIPIGTVKSRLARGVAQLQAALNAGPESGAPGGEAT